MGLNMGDFKTLLEEFEMNYEKFSAYVYRYALCLSGNDASAQDISQEVFKAYWVVLFEDNPIEDKKAWLLKIAFYKHKDIHRRSRKQVTQDDFDQIPNSHPDGVDDAIEVEDIENLREAILMLPRDYCEVILLRAYEELSYEDIAERLEITVGAVAQRLLRARKCLSDILLTKDKKNQTG